jgi:hypothetical protein
MWRPIVILGYLVNVDEFRLELCKLHYVSTELLLLNELSRVWVQTELDHRPVDCRSALAKIVRGRNLRVRDVIGSLRTDPEQT